MEVWYHDVHSAQKRYKPDRSLFDSLCRRHSNRLVELPGMSCGGYSKIESGGSFPDGGRANVDSVWQDIRFGQVIDEIAF
jgi:hypothetical protein